MTKAAPLFLAIDEEQGNVFCIESYFKRSVGLNHWLEGEGYYA